MLKARQHAVTAGQATSHASAANFDTLPDSAFIRESQPVQSERVTARQVGDVRAWIASHCATQQAKG
jgi:hypothetical protein